MSYSRLRLLTSSHLIVVPAGEPVNGKRHFVPASLRRPALSAHRSLYAVQRGLGTPRLAKLNNQVRLYAALGGGDDSPAEATAP